MSRVGVYRVIDIDVMVSLEIRVEGDPEQPAFVRGVDVRKSQEGIRKQDPICDYSNSSVLLADKEPSIRSKGHRNRLHELIRDQ